MMRVNFSGCNCLIQVQVKNNVVRKFIHRIKIDQ